MSISRNLMQNLINDKELIISPYNPSSFVNNHYELHAKNSMMVYDSMYRENTVMDGNALPKYTTVTLNKHGYALEPGKLYNIELKETVQCNLYTCQLQPNANLSRYGVTVSLADDATLGGGGKIVAAVSTTYAVLIYPDMTICDLYLNEGDTGLGSIPVGGIIGWGGGPIPYGYCLCDGSNGSPNLVGRFIKGGTTNKIVNASVMTTLGSDIYELVYIMRYK